MEKIIPHIERLESRTLLSAFSTIVSFTGSNGANPYGSLVMDSSGNLYGTTAAGGASLDGEIFEIAKGTSTISILHSFNGADGQSPRDGLLIDGSGNLFGTTFLGGTNGIGSIFEYSTSTSTFTSLYSFSTPADGVTTAEPYAGLIMDHNGDLFGTTKNGGTDGHGSIFELAKNGSGYATSDTLLYSFTGGNDGKNPYGGLMMDNSGDLFGVARAGGADGYGVIFELASGATATTTLYTFTNGIDGKEPDSALIMDSSGNLYGTAEQGGANTRGDLFELTKSGSSYSTTLTTLYSFSSTTDGQYPWGGPIMDSRGDIFGTLETSGPNGDGGLWELPAGATNVTDLHEFSGISSDGANPYGALFMDPQGDLWGTTKNGGTSGDGTIFEYSSSAKLAFAAQPGNTTAGTLPTVTVNVEDQYGNVITTDSSNVTLLVHSGPGPITGTVTVAAVNGVATFSNAALDIPGAYTLTASDGSDTSATSGSFTVSPAPGTHLAFAVQPGNAAAGAANSPSIVVNVENQFGGIVTTDSSTVALSIASGPGGLSGTVSVAASGGVATFSNVKIDMAGTYALAATDGSLTNATSSGFTINPGAASQVVFARQPSNVYTGNSISPSVVVAVEDQFGNLVINGSSDVVISKASGPGTLEGTLSVLTVGGIATFGNLSLNAPGTYTLSASDGSLTHATSSSFTVTTAGPSQLAFAQQPTSVFAGSEVSPSITVDVEDPNGNIITTDHSNVTLSIASGPGSLIGTLTVEASAGVATFSDIEIDTAGSYTLSASDGTLTQATSAGFIISPGTAAKLAFGRQPTAALVGSAINPPVAVDIEDQYGNIVTTDNSDVTLAVASGPGNLIGTATVTASGGVATFNSLSVDTAGTYALAASDESLAPATSDSFVVSAGGNVSRLAILGQAFNSTQLVGDSVDLTVAAEDQYGNLITSGSASMVARLYSWEDRHALYESATVQVDHGHARFHLHLRHRHDTYSLSLTDGSFTNNSAATLQVRTLPSKWQWWGGEMAIFWSGDVAATPADSLPIVATPAPTRSSSAGASAAGVRSGVDASNDENLLATRDSMFGIPLSRRLLE